MPSKSEEYRASALECLRQSLLTKSEEVKRTLHTLAARWYDMADDLEGRARNRSKEAA
jgi:hypothetical protein